MNITYRHLASVRAILSAALLTATPAWALEDVQVPGAEAASLRNQANELAAKVEKECLKVAAPARPQCRKQMGQAVERLRDRALRAN
jgi:hypothetical protein